MVHAFIILNFLVFILHFFHFLVTEVCYMVASAFIDVLMLSVRFKSQARMVLIRLNINLRYSSVIIHFYSVSLFVSVINC
jgi:hypothetical protein